MENEYHGGMGYREEEGENGGDRYGDGGCIEREGA